MDMIEKPKLHFHFDKVENIGGFALEYAKPDSSFRLLTRASVTSDEPEFYKYVEQITNLFFSKASIPQDAVYQFLILIHDGLSAELYINDFPVAVETMAKRDIKAEEPVTEEDIADIRRLKFPKIKIADTDKVIYCFKVGWKFGLFFDLDRPEKLDIDKMFLTLGKLYRELSFQYLYDVLKTQTQFEEMIRDGWFPFVELLGNEYKALIETYRDKFDFDNRIKKLVESFDQIRIEKITSRWWNKPIFKDKRKLLEAGTSAFLRNNNDGYINCIKTLLTEADGIIRLQYFSDTGKGQVNTVALLAHLVKKGKAKSGSDYSLLLPLPFLNYLKEVIFPSFDLEAGQVDLSRHTAGHGVAKAEAYTKARALQAILVIDQIYFYT